jgi:RNA recognition motif-containing protein
MSAAEEEVTPPKVLENPPIESVIAPAKEGRVILRNLAFDLTGEHLKPTFNKFGPILGIDLPMKEGTKLNRGFAFLEFETKAQA